MVWTCKTCGKQYGLFIDLWADHTLPQRDSFVIDWVHQTVVHKC